MTDKICQDLLLNNLDKRRLMVFKSNKICLELVLVELAKVYGKSVRYCLHHPMFKSSHLLKTNKNTDYLPPSWQRSRT